MDARTALAPAGIPILVYHQITAEGPVEDVKSGAMPLEKFQQQMRYLHERGYRCVSLSESLQFDDGPSSWRRTFVLTFDDGYRNFLTRAYPVLKQYGFTATIFLVTDYAGARSDWSGADGSPLLSWDEVRALRQEGITFGSHTCSHPQLTGLSEVQIRHEFTASKERLEAELDEEVYWLAYPYGESNADIQAIAPQSGYQTAFGVITGESGPYNLWRRPCRANDTQARFAFKLRPGYRRLTWLRWWAREETSLGPLLRPVKKRWLA
jgi:peptidoglycan/xylan/chitin deacetylase (PgdA/CDA1 family)